VRRCAAIAGLCLFALLWVALARAQDALPLELEWQAPAECPNVEAVRAELQRIARVRPGFSLTPLRARATVERHGTLYATTLRTEHAEQAGERALEAPDCDTLAHAVTLVLALAFGAGVELADRGAQGDAGAAAATPNTGSAAAEPAASNTRPPETPSPAAATDQAAIRDADSSRDRTLHAALLVGGGVQLELLPSAAFVASVGGELVFGAFSLGLRANAWPGVRDVVTAGIEARFDGLGGALQACGRLPWSSLLLAACAEARAAALRGRSSHASEDGSATAPWYSLAAAAAVTWPRARVVSVRVQAALAASLDRPRFVITDLQQAHHVPQIAPDFVAFVVVTP
jgi:hypothetical protein